MFVLIVYANFLFKVIFGSDKIVYVQIYRQGHYVFDTSQLHIS